MSAVPGQDRAQAQHDNAEDPRYSGPECACDRWVCPECGSTQPERGTCPEEDCGEELVERDEADVADDENPRCPAHRHECTDRDCCA